MPLSSLQSPPSETAIDELHEHALPQAAVAALWKGQIIDAIKLVRMEQNVDLKEAKHSVDAYLQTQPALKNRIQQTHADAREGLLRWLFFLLFGGAGLMYCLT
jgi:ribosomal protein L7/L12